MPTLSKNNNSIFQNNNNIVFNLIPNQIFPNTLNIFNPLPIQNDFIWNKYQNLYSQILSKDKTVFNTFQKTKQKTPEYKPILTEIKIILNEDSNGQKINNNNLENNGDKNINENLLLGKKRKKGKIYEITKI